MKNIPEFSVSEITSLTKNILEENFERVRIRGEVSKIKENKGQLVTSAQDILQVMNWDLEKKETIKNSLPLTHFEGDELKIVTLLLLLFSQLVYIVPDMPNGRVSIINLLII